MSKQTRKLRLKVTAELKDGMAHVRIVDDIYDFTSASAANVRTEVDAMLAQGVTQCRLYINTRGGDVFEATEIANELARFAEVKINAGAIVASAGTYLLGKFYNSGKSNSQYMIHKPRLFTSGTVEEVEADLKMAKNVTADYLACYAKKTGKTEAAIEKLWAKGDYWMTAQEALDFGLVNEVEQEEIAITAEDRAVLEACGAPIIPEVKIQNKNPQTMDRLKLIAKLRLPADATDAQIDAALDKNQTAADEAAELRKNASEAAKLRAEAIVDKAITDKKITAEKREQFVKLATADYDSAKEVLEAMYPTPKISDAISRKAKGEAGEEHKDWSLDDFIDKDPAAYELMKEEDPERAKKLEDAYFGSKIK